MRTFTLLFDGIPVLLYSFSSIPDDILRLADTLPMGGYAVVMYPERDVDFAVVCFDKSATELKGAHLPLSVISYLFSEIRHLPRISLDILYRGCIYELTIGGGGCIFTENIEKCKLVCTKILKFEDGIEIDADVVECDKSNVCVSVADVELFDEDRLIRLGGICGVGFSAPSLAVSYDGTVRIRSVNDIAFYDAIAIALSTLLRRGISILGGETLAYVGGAAHRFSLSRGRLTFYPNIKYLS